MGLEEYHRGGGWSSFERFILTRSLLQIDAYATGYFAATAEEEPEEGQTPPFPEPVQLIGRVFTYLFMEAGRNLKLHAYVHG